MELHNLKPAKNAVKKRKRIARGQGSGYGGTSTKGNKGAQSRAGFKIKFGFEGGQMPLQRRVPKFGFKNFNRVSYTVFNLDRLQSIADKYKLKTIDPDFLVKHRFVSKNDNIKILGKGKLNIKLEVKAHAFSETAKKCIEAKGGSVVNL